MKMCAPPAGSWAHQNNNDGAVGLLLVVERPAQVLLRAKAMITLMGLAVCVCVGVCVCVSVLSS